MLFSRFSQQVRYFHRSAYLFARGVRRSNELPPSSSSSANGERKISLDEEDESTSMSAQEQFARLELQRLEQESNRLTNEPNSFVDEDQPDLDEDEQRVSIDPSTTSIILFPGQGTQFVGMG